MFDLASVGVGRKPNILQPGAVSTMAIAQTIFRSFLRIGQFFNMHTACVCLEKDQKLLVLQNPAGNELGRQHLFLSAILLKSRAWRVT